MFTIMNRRRGRANWTAAIAVVAATTVLIASCGSDDDSGSATPSTEAAPETTEAAPGTTEAAPETTEAAPETTDASAGLSGDTTSDMSADAQAEVEAAISTGLERVTNAAPIYEPPALYVGVWDPETGSYLTALGEAQPGQPATLQDHYRIGSTTKTFTASVILQLVDEGKLTLDDTIGELLPDLAATHPEIADITVESLLRMKSGIEDYLNVKDSVVADIVADPSRVWEPEELIDAALEKEVSPQGTSGYSTTNSIILQLIAESIEGAPLPELIQNRLLDPLGMTESSLPIEDPSLPEPYASGHLNEGCVAELTRDGATGVDTDTDPTDWSISYAQGGGGITSTLSDLGLWADSNSGNTFLSPDLQEARLIADSPIVGPEIPEIYALGMFQLADNWYGHAGEAIGWQSLVLHDPDTGVSVAFASNTCSTQDLIYWSILNELYPNATLDEFLTSQGL
jgi:D-alanyl-D-alanine carboxypeptidase